MKKSIFLIVGIILAALAGVWAPQATAARGSPCGDSDLHAASLAVDGVTLTLCAPVIPEPFSLPPGDALIQTASSVVFNPFYEVTVTAAPYGIRPAGEDLPVAEAGIAAIYREELAALRRQQGGEPGDGPQAVLFGQTITGKTSVVDLFVRPQAAQPVRVTEWVVEAGGRVWIVRASQEASQEMASLPAPARVSLDSPNVDQPSALLRARSQPGELPEIEIAPQSADDLPFPPWWNGECDLYNYQPKSGVPSYPLQGIYRGVKACGPRPYFDNVSDVLVRFFPGAYGENEWECVELSMRYMYLAYGIPPYPGNGKDVVANYSGDRLFKTSNGTPNAAPQAGDILSYGISSGVGHTSVVSASNVDANGNGFVTIVEQNNAATGTQNLTVTNWVVKSSMTVTGWLHEDHAPTTTVLLEGTKGLEDWYIGDVQVTLTALDEVGGSGVKEIRYRVDLGDWHVYAGPFWLVGDGRRILSYQAVDYSNNWETEQAILVSMDAIPPTQPTQVLADCAESGIWQSQCSQPTFTWQGVVDEHSGVVGYEVRLGANPAESVAEASYRGEPVSEGITELSIRAMDQAGNWSDWYAAFDLRYDTGLPTGRLSIQDQANQTYQAVVKLTSEAQDALSGPLQVRYRNPGGAWSEWMAYPGTLFWLLPGATGQNIYVEAQVQDRAGNLSVVFADSIQLNIYPRQPTSNRYRISRSTIGANATSASTSQYSLNGTAGQPGMVGVMQNEQHVLTSGYWAVASQPIPPPDYFYLFIPAVQGTE